MRIRWTRRASRNLDAIESYVEVDDPVAAAKTVLKVTRAVSRLAEHPQLGRAGRVPGTRELLVAGTPYIAAYRVKGRIVEILVVLHGAMRWPEEL